MLTLNKIKKDLLRNGAIFGVVGLCAAIIHYFTFLYLIKLMWPELANLFAFLFSFSFSFLGHRYLSFNDHQTKLLESLIRFFSTASLGFLNNEIFFIIFHRFVGISSQYAILIAMIFAACQTFLLSRYWAFKQQNI